VWARFTISLHVKDINLLQQIKSYFGVGNISKEYKNILQYRVTSIKDLTNKIIPHFEKFPLITQKKADFILFKEAIDLITRKEHLTAEGLEKIVAIKASINLGLSDVLKTAFSKIVPAKRPVIKDQKIFDPH